MRELATVLTDGLDTEEFNYKGVLIRIRRLIKFEEKSAEGSQATIDRSEHAHVKKSGQAALANRQVTIERLRNAIEAVKVHRDYEKAADFLIQASQAGGKKSVKAARKAPTVALFVQYLAETDSGFKAWLATQGIKA